jgi:nucleoside-triphosphatase THEP1
MACCRSGVAAGGSSTAAVISRVKIMAKLNIAERRLPQDGRIMLRVQGKELDLRVHRCRPAHGESVVMRILDRESVVLDFHKLGFTDEFLPQVLKVLDLPHGILLVTGPTGSGKTTTLYTALSKINTPDVKIITVEDPVEYQIEGINQIQAKPQIGLDFSHALRSIVRQDPDIIMIGEMRDLETAKIAIQSALTGHLVLSTLHTNNAAGGITRLLDMGVEDYLLTSTVNGILAQRLVRRLDRQPRSPMIALPEVIEEFGLRAHRRQRPIRLYKPCPRPDADRLSRTHHDHGIPGDERPLRRLVMQHAGMGEIEQAARADGMRTMYEDGLVKALAGHHHRGSDPLPLQGDHAFRRGARRADGCVNKLQDAGNMRTRIVGELLRKLETARLSRTLGTLLKNGVPLLGAMTVARNVMGNAALGLAVEKATEEVKTGSGLGFALGQSKQFPKLALQMISVGEESGELDTMLLKVADTFDVEVRNTLERLLAALVPVTTVVMTVVVAIIMMAIILPILTLTSSIQ